MNEIEEYLLMIFLESENVLDINNISPITCSEFCIWVQFKKEELGRTLPEEFEFYISKNSLCRIHNDSIACISLDKKKDYYSTVKIKITVVEND